MNLMNISDKQIHFEGELLRDHIPQLWKSFKKQQKIAHNKPLESIDLSRVTEIDSSGVAFLYEVMDRLSTAEHAIPFTNASDRIRDSLDTFHSEKLNVAKEFEKAGFLEGLGDNALKVYEFIRDLALLAVDIIYFGVANLFNKKGQREGSFIQQGVIIGVSALPIVALISFLIGLILALQSAAQLRQFGANIYVADLIGIAMLREMGPIMTAIAVAGRSGSAIASEIATMKVTEELDALQTMALNPIRYVVAPKIQAITLTMPLLTILADLIGILGGFVIGVTYLELSPSAFVNQLLTVLIMKDVVTGLLKSIIFAWIIVIVASHFGLRVTGGAEGVGRATTASVVASIFLVIVADSILGIIFYFNEPIM